MLDFAHSLGPTLIPLFGLTWQGGAIVQYLLAQFLLHWPTTAHLLYKSSFLFFASFYKGQHTLHTFLGSLNFFFVCFVFFIYKRKQIRNKKKSERGAQYRIIDKKNKNKLQKQTKLIRFPKAQTPNPIDRSIYLSILSLWIRSSYLSLTLNKKEKSEVRNHVFQQQDQIRRFLQVCQISHSLFPHFSPFPFPCLSLSLCICRFIRIRIRIFVANWIGYETG